MFFALTVSLGGGCGSKARSVQTTPAPQITGIAPGEFRSDLHAIVTPPEGWLAEPIKASERHTHQVWLSPGGHTAYGVIFFNLPWPIGQDLTLTGFLQQMRRSEGSAELIEKKNDPNLPGLRFVAQGGLYRVRANLVVDGWRGWVVYAGTLVKYEINANDLVFAEQARESTRVGASRAPGSATKPAAESLVTGHSSLVNSGDRLWHKDASAATSLVTND